MSTPPSPRPINPLTLWIPILAIVGGVVVGFNYLTKLSLEKKSPKLPVLTRVEKNLTLVERSGKQVELKELKGKVLVVCWVYTHCPKGCAGVVSSMLNVYNDVGSNPDVHFLSVSVDPDDSPERLKAFADGLQIKGDNWWFVNGPKDVLRSSMTRYFGFTAVEDIPVEKRFSPDDKFNHDFRVALVDRLGQVRGMYDIGSADPDMKAFFNEKIRKDIDTVLKPVDTSANWTMGIVLLSVMGVSVISLIWMAVSSRTVQKPAAQPS